MADAKTTEKIGGVSTSEWLAIAERAAAQRKEAPLSGAGSEIVIPQKVIFARLTKDQGGNDAKGGRHHLFIPEVKMKEYAHNGYRPSLGADGQVERVGEDVCVNCSTEQYEDELRANSARNARQLGAARKDATTGPLVGPSSDDEPAAAQVAEIGPAKATK